MTSSFLQESRVRAGRALRYSTQSVNRANCQQTRALHTVDNQPRIHCNSGLAKSKQTLVSFPDTQYTKFCTTIAMCIGTVNELKIALQATVIQGPSTFNSQKQKSGTSSYHAQTPPSQLKCNLNVSFGTQYHQYPLVFDMDSQSPSLCAYCSTMTSSPANMKHLFPTQSYKHCYWCREDPAARYLVFQIQRQISKQRHG